MTDQKDKKTDKEEERSKAKKPYDPYGYNTPSTTNFSESIHTEEIILAADKAAGEKFEESYVTEEDFEEAREQLAFSKEMADKDSEDEGKKEE